MRTLLAVLTIVVLGAGSAFAQHDGRKQDFHPSVSPDGGRVVFYGYHEPNFPDLFLADLATGEVANLSNSEQLWEIEPEWSPTDNRIAYSRGPSMRNMEVVIHDLDTGEVIVVGHGVNVSWSPDGTRLIWADHGVFRIADLVSGDVRSVDSIQTTGQISEPAWAESDETLVYIVASGGEENNERFDVFWHDMSSGETRQLTDTVNQETHPRLVDGGTTLIFAGALESSRPALYRMDIETGQLGRLLTEEFDGLYTYFPSIAPDGSTVFFEAGDWAAGQFDLYAVPSDGSESPRALVGG